MWRKYISRISFNDIKGCKVMVKCAKQVVQVKDLLFYVNIGTLGYKAC